jgi:hypothetical protein
MVEDRLRPWSEVQGYQTCCFKASLVRGFLNEEGQRELSFVLIDQPPGQRNLFVPFSWRQSAWQ